VGSLIRTGRGLIGQVAELMSQAGLKGRAFVVTDQNVYAHFGQPLSESLARGGFEPVVNMLNPGEPSREPYVASVLSDAPGPVVAVSDWIKAVPDQIARWVPGTFTSLGTDGFGFSDTRPAARRFFHVDAESITVAVLWELARSGAVDADLPAQAIAKYRLDLPVSEALS